MSGGRSQARRDFRYDYGPVAGFYDELANFYSRGRILETKRAHLEHVEPGARVLYPGIGRGEEALEAVRAGARVTGLDVSSSMLRRIQAQLDHEGRTATLVEIDAADYQPEGAFDLVVANYFLNLFDASRARTMLARLAGWVAPGGLLVVSDFARPAGNAFERGLGELYYRPVNWIAWLLGLCALHPILDYEPMLDAAGFRIVRSVRKPVTGLRDPAYVSIFVQRVGF